MTDSSAPLLRVEGLRTVFGMPRGAQIAAVDGVSLSLRRGQTLGIVGESGCGKSILSLSIMGLLPPAGRIAAGRVLLEGQDLAMLQAAAMQRIRGKRIAMVFQEPMTSLNPLRSIGAQIGEAIRTHDRTASSSALRTRCVELLRRVRIPAPERRVDDFPHQMSGGMRQRVMIAMAISSEPDLLIADEPTTALDVTVQAQILDLLRQLQAQTGMAIILITHDLGVVAEMADDIAVMYAGRIVEMAPARELFHDPQHPYTIGLLGSMPSIAQRRARLPAIEGMVPAPFALPSGCRFQPRCLFAASGCTSAQPELRPLGLGHTVACTEAPLEQSAHE